MYGKNQQDEIIESHRTPRCVKIRNWVEDDERKLSRPLTVLELGAGLSLAGFVAALLGKLSAARCFCKIPLAVDFLSLRADDLLLL